MCLEKGYSINCLELSGKSLVCLKTNGERDKIVIIIKGTLSGLRQFLATESPLKLMKNAFYFTLKALFVLKVSKFLSRLLGPIEKRLD